MTTAKRLAETVQHWILAMNDREAAELHDHVQAMIAEILSQPEPQPSATVAEMRRTAGAIWPDQIKRAIGEWADVLEAAERRIEAQGDRICRLEFIVKERESWISELEAAERRIEELEKINAGWSRLNHELVKTISDLESRNPAEAKS